MKPPRRFIDLWIHLENDVLSDPPPLAPKITSLTTHNGTHLDVPWHFHSTQDAKLGGARPSMTIDRVPHGVAVHCFPHKTRGACAGWTRAVAILES